MTEHLEHCESVSTEFGHHRLAMDYILEEFHSDLIELVGVEGYLQSDGKDVIKKMFEKSDVNMRMYGSPQELAENIKIYKNFPGGQRYFRNDLEPYFKTPIIYENLKNDKKYIHKSDLFPILQGMVVRALTSDHVGIHGVDLELLIIVSIVSNMLKNQEKGCVEFVEFDKKVFDEIWKEVQGYHRELERSTHDTRQFSQLIKELSTLGLVPLLDKLSDFIPNNWNENQKARINRMVAVYDINYRDKYELLYPVGRAHLFTEIKLMLKVVEGAIKNRPELFLPGKGPVTVRLFEDGNQKFVMKAELFKALKLPIQSDETSEVIETIQFEKVIREFKVTHIEFIRYPIQRAKHRAVPIPVTHPKDHNTFCIPALDALLKHLQTLILGFKVFQMLSVAGDFIVLTAFNGLLHLFKPDYETPYFLLTTTLDAIEDVVRAQLATIELAPTKNIRNAKKDGFTVQNLKNELVYLNLTVPFPEIQDHAEVVYAHVDKVKKEKYLRTCDLYDALEYCQLICIFERLPNYKKFLHNQGACGRIPGLKCTICGGIGVNSNESVAPVSSGPSKPTKLETPNISEKSEKIDKLAGNLESKKLPENSVKIEIPEKTKNLGVPPLTQGLKSQDVKSEAPPPAQTPPIPVPKESKNCQKCYRTCEMLNETKKELTRNEQKMKKLEKKLGEIKGENTKEIGKKDREMEEFNRKIQKSNQEKEELKGRIEGLEVEKQQMEEKLARQEQSAHESELKLTEQISLLEISLKNESEKSLQLQNEIQISRQNVQNSEVLALEKQQLEQQIGAQNQKIHEFYDSNIRLQAENEINSRMVQQLLDKLASYSNPTGYSNPGGPSNYSNPTGYSNPSGPSNYSIPTTIHSNPTSYNNLNGPSGSSGYSNPTTYSNPQCHICRLEMKLEDQRYCRLIKCQQCGLKLHTSCATNWISAHKTCPSCQGQFLKNSTN